MLICSAGHTLFRASGVLPDCAADKQMLATSVLHSPVVSPAIYLLRLCCAAQLLSTLGPACITGACAVQKHRHKRHDQTKAAAAV